MTEDFQTAEDIYLNDKQLERKLKACLYKKLQNARVAFKNKHVEARGRNDFNHFDYITLKDIVTEAIPILLENDLSIHHKFYMSPPRVELVDLETGYSEDFGSNFDGRVDEKTHNQRLQALGSTESYLRRYIYLQILDIVEGDPDKDFGKEEKEAKSTPRYSEKNTGTVRTNKNIVPNDRVHQLSQQLTTELVTQGVENPSNRNKLELANQWFTEKKLNAHELRALRKLLGAVKP
jgi:hypothetical protein